MTPLIGGVPRKVGLDARAMDVVGPPMDASVGSATNRPSQEHPPQTCDGKVKAGGCTVDAGSVQTTMMGLGGIAHQQVEVDAIAMDVVGPTTDANEGLLRGDVRESIPNSSCFDNRQSREGGCRSEEVLWTQGWHRLPSRASAVVHLERLCTLWLRRALWAYQRMPMQGVLRANFLNCESRTAAEHKGGCIAEGGLTTMTALSDGVQRRVGVDVAAMDDVGRTTGASAGNVTKRPSKDPQAPLKLPRQGHPQFRRLLSMLLCAHLRQC
eukprot:CAMPEP_0194755750 /NCGR_PEP_ID=MMETSP0323_2-20130528/9569_1 /TAXON_ID=2866 ORGANISM="Crypthecodinium cohnii, Strain Seligo" /NCGR_SAMPLE_ID=MMETSP0323_2 /ASSEMBLY_ACC=CAM_ASM_000346 /LENGTH=267 /DNA_ID=CAMNT_0039674963 /DNA_START=121 /DNA_END=924 /DNA_ORIENTATION=+